MLSEIVWRGAFHRHIITIGGMTATPARTVQLVTEFRFPAMPAINAADTQKVGTSQGSCIRLVVGESWECSWTTFLPEGQITVQGPFFDTSDSVLAITGGTGAYRNARGEMELKFHNPAGTKFDFVFHVIG